MINKYGGIICNEMIYVYYSDRIMGILPIDYLYYFISYYLHCNKYSTTTIIMIYSLVLISKYSVISYLYICN